MARKRVPPRCGIPGWRWEPSNRSQMLVLLTADGFIRDAVFPLWNGKWARDPGVRGHVRDFTYRTRREAMAAAEKRHGIEWGIGVVLTRLGRLAGVGVTP